RVIVGADALGAVTRADQRFAFAGDPGLLFVDLCRLDAGSEYAHGLRLVLVLTAVVLAFDDDAGRQVGDAHGRVGLVDVLPAGAGGTECVDADVGRIDDDIADLVRFRQYGNGAGRGVDAA